MSLRKLLFPLSLFLSINSHGQVILDYGDLRYWAAHPKEKDLADGVPIETLSNDQVNAKVDVFFVHPTTYTRKMIDKSWNAPINNAKINAKTDNGTIKHQASVFNGVAKVYAPRYRQAHLKSFYPKKSKGNEKVAMELAYKDVESAFDFFIENWSGSRPFIIASHSQGTRHAEKLVKEKIDGTKLQSRMIAAYLIGMPVALNAFQDIPICNSGEETGCFVSWRTFKFGHSPKRGWGKEENVAVVNPISWETNGEQTKYEEHKGIVLRKYDAIYPAKSSAKIARNILWVTKPRFPGSFLITTKNYHGADYNLFWMDIRKNVEARVYSYLRN